MPATHADEPVLRPVEAPARVGAMDALRGAAVLGILAMNIVAYALPGSAYMDPTADAFPFEGASRAAWWVQHLLFDQKFITIFSMLFGAGLVMMDGRADPGRGFAGVYYRRLLWLFLFGMVHAYAIWYGDILVAYALCGVMLYPLRRVRPGWLIGIGIVVALAAVVIGSAMGAGLMYLKTAAEEAQRILDAGGTLTQEQEGVLNGWREARQGMSPGPEERQRVIDAVRSGYAGAFKENAKQAVFMQTFLFLIWTSWRSLGMMLVGMGLARLGVFAAARSNAFYVRMAVLGIGLGLPVVAYGASRLVGHGFDMAWMFLIDGHFNYVASAAVALGYVALVMLLVKPGGARWLTDRLAAVGRMALTNYLMQSVVCTFVFYGWGLGRFAQHSRAEVMLVVAGVWALQLLWSPWWLARFHYGPAEWLWRTLTYGRGQAMRRVG
jgi:uncharacterized protein